MANLPQPLVNAFCKVRASNWKDEELYKKYADLRAKYLKKLAGDPLEQCGVVIEIVKALMSGEVKQKEEVNETASNSQPVTKSSVQSRK